MAKKSFDFAVIGGGLSGCLVAKALGQQSEAKIAVIEASASVGAETDEILFLPAGPQTDKALDFVESLIGQPLTRIEENLPPVTLEKSHLQTFIGFGEKVPAEVDELMPYLSAESIDVEPNLTEVFTRLQTDLPATVYLKSEVTKLEVDQSQVTAAIINGDQRIEAKVFIVCLPPTELLKILPPTAVDPKIAQKLTRTKLWTSLCLNLIHKKILSDSESMHILTGGESSACIGRFQTTKDGRFSSRWMSFVPGEDFDEEQTASVLREMKRLIKRAYPAIFEDLWHERLVVRPNSHGTIQLKLENDFSLPGIDNLWLSSSLLRAEKNLLGSILQAQRVAGAIQRAQAPPEPKADTN